MAIPDTNPSELWPRQRMWSEHLRQTEFRWSRWEQQQFRHHGGRRLVDGSFSFPQIPRSSQQQPGWTGESSR